MTYATEEAGNSAPLELYRFVLQTATPTVYTYTSGDQPVTFNAGAGDETYVPAIIKREALSSNQETTKSQVNVSLGVGVPVTDLFVNGAAPVLLTCSIFRFHRGADISGGLSSSEIVTMWTGTVAGCAREGAEATLSVVSPQRVLQDAIPRYRIQNTCNHSFCDAGCTVDPATALSTVPVAGSPGLTTFPVTLAGTVTSISLDGLTLGITLASAALPLPRYTAGIVTFGNFQSYINAHTGSSGDDIVVVLTAPIPGLTVGASVTVRRGCNHTFETCGLEFNNIAHFFGFPYVLNSDPWTNGLPVDVPSGAAGV